MDQVEHPDMHRKNGGMTGGGRSGGRKIDGRSVDGRLGAKIFRKRTAGDKGSMAEESQAVAVRFAHHNNDARGVKVQVKVAWRNMFGTRHSL